MSSKSSNKSGKANTKPSKQQQEARKLAAERHKARHYAMQALYSWEHVGGKAADLEAQFRVDFDMKGTDIAYFRVLLTGVLDSYDLLDEKIFAHMDQQQTAECDPVTLALLRLSSYELKERIDVPYKVVINEAVNLAKKFGPSDAHKFVNGVLDKIAEDFRTLEYKAEKG